MKRTCDHLQINLPCKCGTLYSALCPFEVNDLLYDAGDAGIIKMGENMPAGFPRRDLYVDSAAGPCPNCGAIQALILRFAEARVVGVRRAEFAPKNESEPFIDTSHLDIEQDALAEALLQPAGLRRLRETLV